jgi:hypothetical protein
VKQQKESEESSRLTTSAVYPQGSTPYSMTWTLSGNANANAARVSLVNPRGHAVQVNATTVLSAVQSQINSTNNLYVLCTRHHPTLPMRGLSRRSLTHRATFRPALDSDGCGQLADGGEPAVPAAPVVDGGLPEGERAGELDLLGLDLGQGLLAGLPDRRRVVWSGARAPATTPDRAGQRTPQPTTVVSAFHGEFSTFNA